MIPISICMICKNEEQHLEKFFTCLNQYEFDREIVFVDTGSTDRSIEIASKYVDKLLHFDWINDYAAARNFSLDNASHDFVLVLDCDEFVDVFDVETVQAFIEQQPGNVGCILQKNRTKNEDHESVRPYPIPRFFNRKLFHYAGEVHEQVTTIDNSPLPGFFHIPIEVDHFGYVLSEKESRAKSFRYREILTTMLERDPQNSYLLFQLAQTFFFLNDYQGAFTYYQKALADPNIDYNSDIIPELFFSYGYCMLEIGKEKEALMFADIEELFCQYSDYYCLMGQIYFKNKEYLKSMASYVKALSCPQYQTEDCRYNLPHYNIGILDELFGENEKAIAQYQMCKDFPGASERLQALGVE